MWLSAGLVLFASTWAATIACNDAPAAPAIDTTLTIDIVSTHVSGDGPFVSTVGVMRPLTFTLSQSGADVAGDGVVDLVPCPIKGTIDENGTVSMTGKFANDNGFTGEITAWSTIVDASARSQTGQFDVVQRFANAWGPQVILQRAQLQTLTK